MESKWSKRISPKYKGGGGVKPLSVSVFIQFGERRFYSISDGSYRRVEWIIKLKKKRKNGRELSM